MRVDADQRRKDLATIHLGAKALGLDRETYELMLFSVARVRSAADLNFEGRRAVIAHLKARGGFHVKQRTHEWSWVDTAAEDRRPMLRKIIMQLKSAGRARAYVDGMCEKMHLPRLEFCGTQELHKIVSALNIDAGRRAAREIANA